MLLVLNPQKNIHFWPEKINLIYIGKSAHRPTPESFLSNGLCSPYFGFYFLPLFFTLMLFEMYAACAIRSHACEKKYLRSSHSEAGRPGGVKLFQSTPLVHMDKRDQQFTVTGKYFRY